MKTGPIGGGIGGVNALWNFDKYYQRMRGGSAAGVGFNAPAAVGAALAHRKYGRLMRAYSDGRRPDVRPGSCGPPRITRSRC